MSADSIETHPPKEVEDRLLREQNWAPGNDRNENAIAVDFINVYGSELRYVPSWKKWLYWTGTHWDIDHDLVYVTSRMRILAHRYWEWVPQLQNLEYTKFCIALNRRATIDNVITLSRTDDRTTVKHDQLNTNPYLLNTRNGTIDLKTGAFREHRQSDYITQVANVSFDANATCESWNAFIDLIFGEDHEAKRYIRALLGYSLSGDVGEHVLPICYGAGANGKSTIWNTVVELLGDYAMLAPNKLLLGTNNEHDTIIASLYQRRLVAISEPDEGMKLREARVKDLTGDEQVTARRMREDFWSFKRTHKFWLSTNHLPQISGSDEAIWRRIKLIPFRIDLRKATKPIPNYHKLLIRKEGPGILNWLLSGFRDWQENGFIEPQSVITETASYRGQSDEIGRFIADCCDVSPELVVASSDLHNAYRDWGGELSQVRFSTQMQGRFRHSKRTFGRYRNKQVFEGISLQSSGSEQEF
ncbi:MAG: phage/plasmid primase, P4 family [Pirellula sp.]|jgi:putative DNA primase/helicase